MGQDTRIVNNNRKPWMNEVSSEPCPVCQKKAVNLARFFLICGGWFKLHKFYIRGKYFKRMWLISYIVYCLLSNFTMYIFSALPDFIPIIVFCVIWIIPAFRFWNDVKVDVECHNEKLLS